MDYVQSDVRLKQESRDPRVLYNDNWEEPPCTYEQARRPCCDHQLCRIEARSLGFFRFVSRFARLANLLPADPMVLFQPTVLWFSKSCEGRFWRLCGPLGFGIRGADVVEEGSSAVERVGRRGGFVRL
jgi:hypothetical protein